MTLNGLSVSDSIDFQNTIQRLEASNSEDMHKLLGYFEKIDRKLNDSDSKVSKLMAEYKAEDKNDLIDILDNKLKEIKHAVSEISDSF